MTPAKVKSCVERALRKWRPITDTDRWELDFHWTNEPGVNDGATMGVVCPHPQYEMADFYTDCQLIALSKRTAAGIEYDTIHELCHLHLAQLARLAEHQKAGDRVDDANETATKKFASALWRAQYGMEPPTVRG